MCMLVVSTTISKITFTKCDVKNINNLFLSTAPTKVPEFDAKVQRLIDMGIFENEARAVLSKYNWNLEKTTEYLFS